MGETPIPIIRFFFSCWKRRTKNKIKYGGEEALRGGAGRVQGDLDLVDTDKGGSISKEELAELMETLGINASHDEIDMMVSEIDEDSNGEIDFDEFVAVMARKVNAKYTQDEVKKAFRTFEGNAPADSSP